MLNKHIHKLKVNEKAYKLFFGTLTSQSRLKIINILKQGKKNVSEIKNILKIEQTIISHDLKRLKSCGFVSVEKKGKYRYYSLNNETIKPLMEIIDKHMVKYCEKIIKEKNDFQKKMHIL